DHQVQRAAVHAADRAGEVDEPARALADGEVLRRRDQVAALLDQEPRYSCAAAGRQRQIAVLAAEHQDREAGALAVARAPQTPPGIRRVDDADAAAALEQRLDDRGLRGERLPAPGLAQDGDVLAERGLGNDRSFTHL